MKYLYLICLSASAIFFVNCKGKPAKVVTPKNTVDTVPYFSITGFLDGEIKDVQQTPYYLYEITSGNNKRDSAAISKEEFARLANEFVKRDISKPGIKENYKEDIFRDATTQSVTLTYSALNKSSEIQGVDVLLDETTNKVKRIFIRTMVEQGDSIIAINYNWKAGKSFLINRSVIKRDNSTNSIQRYVNWDDAVKEK